MLEKAGETVIDVGSDDAENEEEVEQADGNERSNDQASKEDHPSAPVDSETRKTQ